MEQLSTFVNPKHFHRRLPLDITISGKTFKTIFTDQEAFSICSGISNRRKARNIWIKYCKDNHTENDTLNAHLLAMEALKDVGANQLNLIMGVPPLNITNIKVYDAFYELKKKVTIETCIQITIRGKQFFKFLDDDSEYVIRFLSQKKGKDFDHLEIIKKNRTATFLKITKARVLISRVEKRIYSSDKKPVPKLILKILFSFLNSPRKFIVGFGSEILECRECGAILTATKSLNAKHGPICSKHLRIKY